MRVCFFAKLPDKSLFEIVEFYRNDIRALHELGADLVVCNKFAEIPWDCDLYFTWWWGSGILSLIKSTLVRRPNIVTGTIDLVDHLPTGFSNRPLMQQLIIRLSLRLATASLALCQFEYDAIVKLKARHPWLVRHGVDTELYQPANQNLAQRQPVIFTVSHLVSWNIQRKKLKEIIEAAPLVLERHPQIKFVLAGSHGPGFEVLVNQVKELKLEDKIIFPGRISFEEKRHYYQTAAVYLQPSSYEGFGMAIAEAMSCGLPPVSSPVGAVPELVADCGLYADGDNVTEIANQVCCLLEDEALWQRLSRQSRERIEKLFSYKQRKEQIAKVIEHVMSSNEH